MVVIMTGEATQEEQGTETIDLLFSWIRAYILLPTHFSLVFYTEEFTVVAALCTSTAFYERFT